MNTQPTPLRRGASVPPIERAGLGYVWTRSDLGVILRVDYLRERSDEFTGELTVESAIAGTLPHLHAARLNLSATRTRKELATYLTTLTPGEDLPWRDLLEAFCVTVMRREREGEPLQHVGRLPGTLLRPDAIERLLPAGKPTLWYGPQGGGKGWLAVAACVCHQAGAPLAGLHVQQGRALYLDWEDNAETLDVRVQAVCAGLDVGPMELAYRKCRRTMARDLHPIMRYAADEGATLIVVDSVGLAAGAAGERGSYEDVALTLFDALRQLEPATVLLIDHVAGAEVRRGEVAGKAIGSIYKMAEARAAWELRSEQEADGEQTYLGCYHTKHNHSRRYPAIGLRLEFAPSDPGDPPAYVRLHRHDLAESVDLGGRLSLAEQLAATLRRGPRKPEDLAKELGAKPNAVRVCLNRGKDQRFVRLEDGRWGLLHQGVPSQDAAGPLPMAARRRAFWDTESDEGDET